MQLQGAFLRFRPSVKKLAFGLCALFLILFVVSSFSAIRPKQKIQKGNKAQTAETGNKTDIYYADLEIDSKLETITQLRTGKTVGQVHRSKEPVSSTEEKFIYKIDVHDKQNNILEEGWHALTEKNITTGRGTLSFRIDAPYSRDAIVRVFNTSNELLWTGVMP